MSRVLFFIVLVFLSFSIHGQSADILGRIDSKTNIENIHVINKTAQIFTITDKAGHFTITAKLNDTLEFSSVQHKLKEVVISDEIISTKAVFVGLDEHINELDEVIVGKVLSGDLLSDIKNTEGNPPINFFDVGISGYTGKPATQSESRLAEATSGGGFIPLNPILNAISGRTKKLKLQVKLEEKDEVLRGLKTRLSEDFLASNPLKDDLVADFFYFCADDENFLKHCKNQNDFKILIFLRMKYKQYIANSNSNKK